MIRCPMFAADVGCSAWQRDEGYLGYWQKTMTGQNEKSEVVGPVVEDTTVDTEVAIDLTADVAQPGRNSCSTHHRKDERFGEDRVLERDDG
jgi:hypothetical protein